MVCREPLLRYTDERRGGSAIVAMVCREPLLRYTTGVNTRCVRLLWFAGNRC